MEAGESCCFGKRAAAPKIRLLRERGVCGGVAWWPARPIEQGGSKVGPGHSKPATRRPKETRRPRSELIATLAEQPPIELGHSRSSDFRAAGRGAGALEVGPRALLIGLFLGLLFQRLEVFLVWIALLAGFAFFMGGNTALVLALLAIGGGLLTAGQLLSGFVNRQG